MNVNRKYLLSKDGNFYKANLHSHTIVSDGHLTPVEAKKAYKEKGYSVIAFTDHNVILPCQELSDKDFLALEGVEIDVSDYTTVHPVAKHQRNVSVHINMIALRPSLPHPCWHDDESPEYGTVPQYRDRMIIKDIPQIKRQYSNISGMMKHARDLGYFVVYNHPSWNLENYPRYMRHEYMNAVEVLNGGSIESGVMDDDIAVYDDMLRGGKRIFCVGGDDNHNGKDGEFSLIDSFRAWTVIKAKSLDYASVGDALLAGNFYTSEGPEITELYLDGDILHIECSDADNIRLSTAQRICSRVRCKEGEALTSADFKIHPASDYFRVTVTDKRGRRAFTNAYFLDTLGLETAEVTELKATTKNKYLHIEEQK